MDSENDITARILESLSSLSADEQNEAILAVISAAIKSMSIYRILEVRAEIIAELDGGLPVVRATLDMIDGQIALRDIAGDDRWR